MSGHDRVTAGCLYSLMTVWPRDRGVPRWWENSRGSWPRTHLPATKKLTFGKGPWPRRPPEKLCFLHISQCVVLCFPPSMHASLLQPFSVQAVPTNPFTGQRHGGRGLAGNSAGDARTDEVLVVCTVLWRRARTIARQEVPVRPVLECTPHDETKPGGLSGRDASLYSRRNLRFFPDFAL